MTSPSITIGDCTLDDANILHGPAGSVRMRTQRADFTRILMLHANHIITRGEFLDTLWAGRSSGPEERIIDVLVCGSRKALAAVQSSLRIERVWARGYVLRGADAPLRTVAFTEAQWLALHRAIDIAERHVQGIRERIGLHK